MKVNCTWDDLYKAAMDKGYGEPELKAKDTARGEVSILMRQCPWYRTLKDISYNSKGWSRT